MKRAMPYKVLLPKGYNADRTTKYPVIYLLHGLWGHYDDWATRTKLAEYARPYNFIIVMPEGGDSWYSDGAEKWESYISRELLPEVETRFRTINDREHRVIAGLSMGGYAAIKYGLRNPERYALVGSFSGALEASDYTGANAKAKGIATSIGKTVDAVFGPENSEIRRNNNIFAMLRAVPDVSAKNLPFIYESCGTEDPFVAGDRIFMGVLIDKKIPHEYRELPGVHGWTFWDDQIREFLAVADRKINH